MAVTLELPDARRLAFGVVLGQAAVTLAAGLVCYALGGARSGISALAGGGIGTLASLAMVALAFGPWAAAGAARMLTAFFGGELAKLVVVVALFAVVLHSTRAAPGPLLAGFGATFLVYWIVLAGSLPAGGRPRPARDPHSSRRARRAT